MIERVQKRDIVTTILLSIITCGIYAIVWFYMITEDCGKASGDKRINPGSSILFTLLTCGIYMHYWNYQMGKRIALAQEKRNLRVNDKSDIYLILSIFGFGIISEILIQSELNNLAEIDNQNVTN